MSLPHSQGDSYPHRARGMLALSVRQPWAWCLFRGKDIENRVWPLPDSIHGELVAIHASNYKDWSLSELTDAQWQVVGGKQILDLVRGALIGVGRFTGCLSKEATGLWKVEGQYGFQWTQVRKFLRPIPCKGALGFFHVPRELDAVLRQELEL